MGGIPFFPEQASTHAGRIDLLFLFLLVLTIFFTALVAVGIVYFAVRYRRRHADEIPPQTTGNTRIEVGGMVGLLGLSMVAFFWGAWLFVDLQQPPANTLEIYVIAKKWMWKYEYADGQQSINDLYVPVGQPVKLTMTSQDVIHSYFVPAFRVKQDVLPGRYTTLWFEATETGTYHLFCAEYCGTNHSRMVGSVIVMEPAEYEQWLAGGSGASADGEELFTSLGCASCHQTSGQGPGPSLVGVFGETVTLQGGETIEADATYIRTSILDPTAHVVEGFEPIMPTYEGQVTEEQLLRLLNYIQSLEQ
ncbi:MAG: cytochrome c oxidase subunit II [Ardenticatenales bacterium]|nr:cytochrome c oxidase subunit II [Ardenticatenales bacterium]